MEEVVRVESKSRKRCVGLGGEDMGAWKGEWDEKGFESGKGEREWDEWEGVASAERRWREGLASFSRIKKGRLEVSDHWVPGSGALFFFLERGLWRKAIKRYVNVLDLDFNPVELSRPAIQLRGRIRGGNIRCACVSRLRTR